MAIGQPFVDFVLEHHPKGSRRLTHSMASSGYVAQVDETLCAACATCADACAFEAIEMDGTAIVNWESCMGCGVCVGQCPNEAVTLVRDERKGVPLDVRLLVQEQAVG
jgi:heterodisulfide reductase subunit A-like polyferredoxin